MTHPLQPQIIKCVGGKNFDGSFLRWAAGKLNGDEADLPCVKSEVYAEEIRVDI